MSFLKNRITEIQSQGRYVFSKAELHESGDVSERSLNVLLSREKQKKNIQYIGQGLYLIVPPEYRVMGAPPPEWYIHDLMQQHQCHYYVGLLTAASYYGASHQAIQIFQVVCDKQLPSLTVGRSKICFYYSKDLAAFPYSSVNTQTGTMKLSTPEGTAFDLIKFMKQSGHLNHVATVLSELAEKFKVPELKRQARLYPVAYTQRLGYILDVIGASVKIKQLHAVIEKLKPRFVPLYGTAMKGSTKDKKWKIIITEELDPDIL